MTQKFLSWVYSSAVVLTPKDIHESKIVKFIEAEKRKVIATGRG